MKLPLCPYCKAIYRYGDVKRVTHNKSCECHNCKRKFSVSYIKGRIIIILITTVILIALNLLLFNFVNGVTVIACLIINALFISLAVILFPFTVRFKKLDGEEKAEINNDAIRRKKRSQKNASRKNKKQSDIRSL